MVFAHGDGGNAGSHVLAAPSMLPRCNSALTNVGVGESCSMPWTVAQKVLRPGQDAIGYAWVALMGANDFTSMRDVQALMDKSPIPVAKAPHGSIFIVDHHHTLAALDASGFSSVNITIYVACDDASASSLDASLAYLWGHGLVNGLSRSIANVNLPPAPDRNATSSLPTSLRFRPAMKDATLKDDPWRSLVSFVFNARAVGGSSMRAFRHACDAHGREIPFVEFRWAFFFNDAFIRPGLWHSQEAAAHFRSRFRRLANVTAARFGSLADLRGKLSSWEEAARCLVPLARSESAARYTLPASMGSMAGPLPGIIRDEALATGPDPMCTQSSCRA